MSSYVLRYVNCAVQTALLSNERSASKSHEYFISDGATFLFQTPSHSGSALTANFAHLEVRWKESSPLSRVIWTSWIMRKRVQRQWKTAKPYVESTGPFCTLSTPSWRLYGALCLNCTVMPRATAWRTYRTSFSNERSKSARTSCQLQT